MKNTFIVGLAGIIIAGVALILPNLHQAPATLGGSGAIDSVSYHCWAGVCHFYGSASLKAATTTPCAIQAPAATSTLSATGIRLDVSSSTATVWDIAKASTAYATTTALGTAYTVSGGAQAFVQASTSPGANTVLAPSSWVVFGARQGITAGDAGTGFVPSGTCFASFTAPQS